MEIKIDTSKDSKEELKAVIKLLQAVVGDSSQEASSYSNPMSTSAPANPGMFNIFGSPESPPETPTVPPSSPPPDYSPAPPTIQDIVKKPRDRRFGDDDGDPKVIIVDY